MGAMQFPKHSGRWHRTMTQAMLIAACWAGAVVSGRLLAYTYIYLDSSFDVY